MNRVLRTMQIVIDKSTKGSITIRLTVSLILSHTGPHSQIRKVLANLYQHGGHFLCDSSSSLSQTYEIENQILENPVGIFFYVLLLVSLKLNLLNTYKPASHTSCAYFTPSISLYLYNTNWFTHCINLQLSTMSISMNLALLLLFNFFYIDITFPCT